MIYDIKSFENSLEIWWPIPDHKGYEASNLGRIKSLPRKVPDGKGGYKKLKGKMMTLTVNKNGYKCLRMGEGKQYDVHRVIAWTFNGPKPKGLVVNHIDGNKLNNTPKNLEYISNRDNLLHAHKNGLIRIQGENNGNAILSDTQVLEIRTLHKDKTVKELTKIYCVSKYTIWDIRSGTSYKHLLTEV